jgi:presenilin-like A22 family membrane protease
VAAGVVVYAGSAFGRTRAYRGRRVPGLWPSSNDPKAPWWTGVGMLLGPLLMVVASAKATETDGGWYFVLGAAVAVGLIGHAVVIWMHNLRAAKTIPHA